MPYITSASVWMHPLIIVENVIRIELYWTTLDDHLPSFAIWSDILTNDSIGIPRYWRWSCGLSGARRRWRSVIWRGRSATGLDILLRGTRCALVSTSCIGLLLLLLGYDLLE